MIKHHDDKLAMLADTRKRARDVQSKIYELQHDLMQMYWAIAEDAVKPEYIAYYEPKSVALIGKAILNAKPRNI